MTDILERLYQTILDRKKVNADMSYVAALFARGRRQIAQKVGEEAVETVLASAGGNQIEIVAESADLMFHLMVLWAAHGVTPDMVMGELKRREGKSGIAEKQSRQELKE